ncbi:MAG TPA: helix-turn-helix transcriptional regulator [Agitococcus sp.]|uniref:helix-turn-helix domain-containing protein n=1 Tax=uncultured Agitococcus sp. TaxID=1506599 RepID=UPI0026058F4E|nr:helix-turn-helix transcriptional regulator [uncultured Agitococcus sp.]HMU87998.1 helix-turn-helix transcriptional regulator [Agitococcus sp.]HNC04300.1 helix-turn-helix transcriptional regulator [Agitococcus sp.]HNC87248.1 helix-turn-helix transcriptional regulator [Agitococcus sp.]HNE92137.1 helix-turn-helix transcriptional regulator [Agitococcus sp.]HNH43989.1 helix-turn-helix transcriptional regulator [Agitococcus sp.]
MDSLLTLNSAYDVQQSLAEAVRIRRKQKKWSRQELAERSGVPAATIKHFESTGQISLRQFLLLWQLLDSLDTILELTSLKQPLPQNIDDVLKLRT